MEVDKERGEEGDVGRCGEMEARSKAERGGQRVEVREICGEISHLQAITEHIHQVLSRRRRRRRRRRPRRLRTLLRERLLRGIRL